MNLSDRLVFQRTWKTLFHVILISFWLILADQALKEWTLDLFWFLFFAWVQFYFLTVDWNVLDGNPLSTVPIIAVFCVMMVTFTELYTHGELGGTIGEILEFILLWSWTGKYFTFFSKESKT